MPSEFTRLSSEQLKALSPEQTVFFFGVGPLEDHGPHLPLGMDLLEAHQLCFSAAERLEREMPGWTGVLMPPSPLGIESNTQNLSITVRPHVLRDWLVDACRSLKKAGFRHFVCFSGHLGPKQLTAIEDAAKIFNRESRFRFRGKRAELVSASSSAVTTRDLKDSLFWPDPLEHGGSRDTSIALWMKHVPDPSMIPSMVAQRRDDSMVSRGLRRLYGHVIGAIRRKPLPSRDRKRFLKRWIMSSQNFAQFGKVQIPMRCFVPGIRSYFTTRASSNPGS